MVKKGLKVSKEQLYSMNQACIKDAIIIFGGGCTGEIVSKEGLIFTNHHCGYNAIAAASSVEHNYLRDGFYAFNKDQELKSNLTVQFLEKIVDKEVSEEYSQRISQIIVTTKSKIEKHNNTYKTTKEPVDTEIPLAIIFWFGFHRTDATKLVHSGTNS
jgi:hypothetical protein